MYIKAKTIDDLMHAVLEKLLKRKSTVHSTRGDSLEISGVLLELSNPLARLSRTETKGTIFSCIGELLWYLAGSNRLDYIQYYIEKYAESSDDGFSLHGAYGPRLFNMHRKHNQIENIIKMLKIKPSSRQAVIQLYDALDITKPHLDVPCTCTMQFLIRNSQLDLFVTMRSNDAFKGMPHDIFAFTMLQEIVARSLNVKVGKYKHFAVSLHLYEEDIEKAKEYLNEGWQSSIEMPPMPIEDLWNSIKRIVGYECTIRNGNTVDIDSEEINDYWKDLTRILQIYQITKTTKNTTAIEEILKNIKSGMYHQYIRKRQEKIIQGPYPFQYDLLGSLI